MTERVKAKVSEVNKHSDFAVIPGWMSKLLQSSDVFINRPCKVAFQQLYQPVHMTMMKHKLTPTGRMKCAPFPTVCE
jgi:hypothetical protein